MSSDEQARPQTLIFSRGYDPQRSEGAAIPPVFRTSTFIFRTAAEGKRAFEIAYGLAPIRDGESPALIYTRVNNPNSEILEDRVIAWDGAEASALFSSGMGAISNTCFSLLLPGDTLVFSDPAYGGSEYLFRHILPAFHIKTVSFPAGATTEELERIVRDDPTVKVIYIECPSNPTMMLSDIPGARAIADRCSSADRKIRVVVDNTFMGPVFLRPLRLGADIVLYSATKFFGGHSDLVAGIAMGSRALVDKIKVMRTILGSNSDPDTAWLIHRSLGTLQLRMEKQQESARRIVAFLLDHEKVDRVAYPGLAEMGSRQVELWRHQCTGTGSLVTFTLRNRGRPRRSAFSTRSDT